MSKNKILKKIYYCAQCRNEMIECNALGHPSEGGGYRVCPVALEENTPEEFSKGYRARRHREARIEETIETEKKRREFKADQPSLLPADAGKRKQRA